MDNPRRARVVEQHFLNLPGFEAGRVCSCLRRGHQRPRGPPELVHKIDTLIAALCAFREGMAAEAALRRRRMREIDRASVVAEGDDRLFARGRGVLARSLASG